MRWPRGHVLVLAALLVVDAAVRVAIIHRPFVANSEGLATGWVLSSARNTARYGPWRTRFTGVLNSGPVPSDRWIIYSHHPPLTALASAAAFRVFGVAEWSGRIVPALFSLATTVLLFVIARRRYGIRPAAAAGFLYAFCPMTLALGDMAEYMNAPFVFFGVATMAAYVRWSERGGRRWAWTCAACFVLGALSDWPIFYLVPIMGVHAWLSGRARVVQIGILSCAAAGVFALLAWWTAWSGGDVSVFHQFAVRTSRTGITLRGWFERVIVHHQGMLHTWPVLALSAIYVARVAQRAATGRRPPNRDAVLPMLLLAWGVMNLAVGIDGNYRHEWWSMMLTPGLAMTAALGLEEVIQALPPRLRVPRIAAPLAVASIVIFAAMSARAALAFTRDEWFRGDGYTLEGLGRIMARVAAPDEGILTTVRTDHPALWFYADRQLRVGVTSPAALDAALAPGPYVVFYDYVQPYGPAPTWFVMPLTDRERYPNLAAALDARFRRDDRGGFSIFRLR